LSQAAAASLLGGAGGVGSFIPKVNNNAAYIGREAIAQRTNTAIVIGQTS